MIFDPPVPRRPAPKYVDTAIGDRHELDASGLVPKYVNKKVRSAAS